MEDEFIVSFGLYGKSGTRYVSRTGPEVFDSLVQIVINRVVAWMITISRRHHYKIQISQVL